MARADSLGGSTGCGTKYDFSISVYTGPVTVCEKKYGPMNPTEDIAIQQLKLREHIGKCPNVGDDGSAPVASRNFWGLVEGH
ncbi:hypothetical protein BLNAU_13249 [Blattamonas nauphoetae]|uniref:Uncharacterized protein n=1 Tax=Blattamonas nauphoetae TaxID=2049346 RepID=A0ABQ9XH24_9EUKA|nr:hypothetical protein BLNAU_13249 [Blattamonas nauphoetae]